MKNKFVKWGGFIAIFAIIIVFLFYGVYSGSQSTQGIAGWVNGEAILEGEFRRELEQRMQMYSRMNFPQSQIKAMGIERQVFDGMVRQKLVLQGAKKLGLEASSEAVRKTLTEIPSFQIDGKFDLIQYEKVLADNNLTPGRFEERVRDDLTSRQVQDYFQNTIYVSDAEAKSEFALTNEKRKLRYVILTPEAVQKNIQVTPAEVQAFIKDPANADRLKNRFETFKDTKFKGKTQADVQVEIAKEMILPTKSEEQKKLLSDLAAQVASRLKPGEEGKKSINAFLKEYKTEAQDTLEPVNQKSTYISGLGAADDLLKDLFGKSEKPFTQGSAPRVYDVARGKAVVLVIEATSAAKIFSDDDAARLKQKLKLAKANQIVSAWMDELKKVAKIEVDKRIVPQAGPEEQPSS